MEIISLIALIVSVVSALFHGIHLKKSTCVTSKNLYFLLSRNHRKFSQKMISENHLKNSGYNKSIITRMEKVEFSIATARQLFDEAETVLSTDKKKVKQDTTKGEEYVKKYFYPMTDATHMFWDADAQTFLAYKQPDAKTVYFARLPKSCNDWYFKTYDKIFKAVADIHQPRVFGNKINMSQRTKNVAKPQAENSAELKSSVEFMVSFIKEVLCNGNEVTHQYLLKWVSFMCKGKKNNTCLYFKGID
jgi:hypothetical protein